MNPSIILPQFPTLLRDPYFFAGQTVEQLVEVERLARECDVALAALAAAYDRICVNADTGRDGDQLEVIVQTLWADLSSSVHDLLGARGKVIQSSSGRVRRAQLNLLDRIVDRLTELMRTIAVVWEELELETPDDIADAVWTIRVSPRAYLRAMWNLFWSSIRHPFSETVIELKTGRVLRHS